MTQWYARMVGGIRVTSLETLPMPYAVGRSAIGDGGVDSNLRWQLDAGMCVKPVYLVNANRSFTACSR